MDLDSIFSIPFLKFKLDIISLHYVGKIADPHMSKKYQIIYADPPWQYNYSASNSRKIENQYPTMLLEDIKNMNVPSEDNSALYLWTTAPKLVEGIEVVKAWGFDYRSCLIWDKEIAGMGYWFRIQHEILLVGVKGNFSPPSASMRVPSIIRVRRASHSDKPDQVRELISKWFPKMSKIELFAREKTPLIKSDWDCWGNEIK